MRINKHRNQAECIPHARACLEAAVVSAGIDGVSVALYAGHTRRQHHCCMVVRHVMRFYETQRERSVKWMTETVISMFRAIESERS